jgi:hypothetical protein
MTARPWWRDAVTYEVYPRSFADGNGDGDGDLEGLLARLPYLADLGVDALWIAPWYPSPLGDGGYDVSDHRDIHPMFGTLADADAVLAAAHALGLRVLVDVVANHTSDAHPWFADALAAGPGSAARARYFFRDGRGPGGAEPPNNWISAFGGSAWSRVTEPDGSPGQWYLHLFAAEQPDVDWRHPEVADHFDDVLRFWFDRGVDGVRVDAAPALVKADGMPDADYGGVPLFVTADWEGNPHWDVDDVHAILRRWRRIGDAYAGDRVFVAEAIVNGPERLSRYLRPDEMHTAFNFGFLKAGWGPGLRDVVDDTLAALASTGAPPTWVLGSHDETRLVTRFGRGTSPTSRARPPISRSAPAAPARPRCSCSRCPAARTSTRATSSACPTSRTSPTTGGRTRCGTGRGTRCSDATAAGCRCRGAATGPPSASPRTAPARGSRSPPVGPRSPCSGRPPTRPRCSRCTGPRSGFAGRSRASTRPPSPGTTGRPTCSTSTGAAACAAW